MSTYVHERITEQIVALLKQGTVPWHKSWNTRTQMPRNLVTKKPYRGINVFLLLAANYEVPFWLTFRQAVQLGGTVRRGEQARPVVFWKPFKVEDEETSEERQIPLLRYYHVFNVSQCEGITDVTSLAGAVVASMTSPVKPEAIVAGMQRRPLIKHGMTHPFYTPGEDVVGMPMRERFDTVENYYATLFHELIHATGHKTRMHRTGLMQHRGFGSDPYCKEELVAEMGASFLCAESGIVERTIDNSAAYVQSWLEQLQNDKTLVVQAAAQAQKATDFILSRAPSQPVATDEPRSASSPEPAVMA